MNARPLLLCTLLVSATALSSAPNGDGRNSPAPKRETREEQIRSAAREESEQGQGRVRMFRAVKRLAMFRAEAERLHRKEARLADIEDAMDRAIEAGDLERVARLERILTLSNELFDLERAEFAVRAREEATLALARIEEMQPEIRGERAHAITRRISERLIAVRDAEGGFPEVYEKLVAFDPRYLDADVDDRVTREMDFLRERLSRLEEEAMLGGPPGPHPMRRPLPPPHAGSPEGPADAEGPPPPTRERRPRE